MPEHSSGTWRPTPLLAGSAALHVAAVAGAAAFPAHWPLAAGAVLANHVALAGVGMWPRSTGLGPNLRRLDALEGAVALTFDDGPDPRATPRVLDLLDQAGARATFFCIGRRALEHSDLAAEIARRGHRLENHSFRHSNLFALHGPRALARELDRTQEVLAELGGRTPVWFRAPAGIRSPWLEPMLVRRGLRLVSWTRRGFDAVDRDPARVSHRLLAGLAAGDILVLHDGSLLSGQDPSEAVLTALARILDALAGAGLESVALPDPSEVPA